MQKKKNLFLKDIVEISPNITMSEKHSTFHINGQLNLNEKISTEISFSLMNHKTNHEYSMKSQLTKSDSNSSTYNFEAFLNLDELSFETQDDYFSIIVHVEEVYYHHSQMVAFQTNKRFNVLNDDTIIYFEEVGLSKTFQLLNTQTFFSKYEHEAEIHDVTLDKSTHHILIKGPKKTGIVRQIPYSLVLKKRKAEDEYVHTVPDESIHAQWETSLSFKNSDHFLTEGIWDFYLEAKILEAHKRERLSYPLEQSTLPKPFLTELNHKLYAIEFYQTIKGNLSIKVTERKA
ncbi:MATH domain-containing protein [Alkalihalobacillus sp. 1P02AB]|uniref:MATH domain-containing protein n=1 Tax=Alkalihalobacillus sp. 1P02AB TaxID=3132260 RepID=UPI0039A5A9CC